MGTQTWRKAYGTIKDHTQVGLARVNSDFKDVDVAIVKATNHVESPPKERHLRKIMVATSSMRPRADVAYCIHALSRRLAKTHNWTVALKTLIVIHRTLREGDPAFREELLNFQQKGRVLEMSNFKDDSSPIAWDCSAWVRTYGIFLEERLECFRILKYDIEAEHLPRPSQGEDKGYSKTRDLESEVLLEQLPALQNLLYRLIGCRPEGAALGNYIIQYALALVLKESFKIYCTVNDGIINLVDKFFDMPRHEAVKALDIYKRAGQQATTLSDFYEICKGLELARNFQFPVLREPPQSFLVTMEEYINEAPRMVSAPSVALELPERLMLTYKQEDAPPPEEDDTHVLEGPTRKPLPFDAGDVATPEPAFSPRAPPPPTNSVTDDLLGLNTATVDASAIEDSNALALSLIPSGANQANHNASQPNDFDPSGWELALVATPSTNLSSLPEKQLAGGLDSLTLESLYDEAAYRSSQQSVYAQVPNPFGVSDPFATPNGGVVPQMAAAVPQHQSNPFGLFQETGYPQAQQQMAPPNPFGDGGFGEYPVEPAAPAPVHAHPQVVNPFGSTGLLQ